MSSVFGKILGAMLGFIFYGGIGALLGFIIGHVYDSQSSSRQSDGLFQAPSSGVGRNQQKAFTTGIIVLGAKMAKADGRVTRAEIEAFKRVFNVAPGDAAYVGRMFDRARQNVEGFEPYAFQLAQMFAHSPAVLEQILGGLFVIAAADSAGLSPAEIRFLQRVAMIFGFDTQDFSRIAARSGVRMPGPEATKPRNASSESFAILGVSESATNEEIKVSYRALIRKHHPDMLLAAGMAPEFVASAEEKMKRINVAYDVVSKLRGIR